MAVQIRRIALKTFMDFVTHPENSGQDYEFIGGEIKAVVSHPISSKIASRMNGFIFMYLQQHDIGHLTGADGGYQIGNERYIPDVGFITYTRQPELISDNGYIPNPTNLAVEVVSPTDEQRLITIKVANYLAAGTLVWLVYPDVYEVEVYYPGEAVKVLGIDDILNGYEILPEFSLPLKMLFASMLK